MKKRTPPSITTNDQSFEFIKLNTGGRDWRDVYHWLLTLSWPRFSAFLFGSYVVINTFFALLYCLGGACVDGMPTGSFPNAFFFSVETLATVGYGHMYPATVYAHIVATVEIMFSMLGTALMTGLIFVRFARPTARIVFSRVLVLSNFNGQPALMLRVANERRQAMVNATFRLMMVRHDPTTEDPTMYRFHVLPLQVDHMVIFPAAVTIRHLIDERSPLHGETAASLAQKGARFMASVECIDKVIQAAVQNESVYQAGDVRHGHRFVEIYNFEQAGPRQVDYGRLHDTEPAEEILSAPVTDLRVPAPAADPSAAPP